MRPLSEQDIAVDPELAVLNLLAAAVDIAIAVLSVLHPAADDPQVELCQSHRGAHRIASATTPADSANPSPTTNTLLI